MNLKTAVWALAIFLVVSPIIGLSQHDNSSEAKTDNAAVYYLEAIDLLKYPVTDEKFKQKIENVIKNRWYQEDEVLENFIKDNKSCLESIKKAELLTNCNFSYKKKYKYLVEKESPPGLELLKLQQLLLINARYHEYQNNWNRAANSCFTALTLAYHVSQDNSLLGKILSLALERKVYPILKEYLQSATADIELAKITEHLNDHKKRHFPVKALVDEEKKFFISTVQMLADGVKKRGEEKYSPNTDTKNKVKDFTEEFMKQANQLANEYYGNFVKAIESNKDEDWQKALNALESLRNSAQPNLFEKIADSNTILFNSFTGNSEEYNEVFSRRVLITLLAIGIPDFKKATDNYYIAMDELNELLTIIDAKIK